ncbi:MAG: transporter substrate-binding protein [Herbaspirillum sp.]|jgi:NitT/TauT family transport system substrate-binding protein|nr:transporter substrate-binding protein [Herbaspirillum sp.]
MRNLKPCITALLAWGAIAAADAADIVKVGVFTVSSALPYFVAVERGYFKEAGIETEMVQLNTGPLLVQAMVAGQIDATSNLVTLEGANIDARRPGSVMYLSINGQNEQYKMEQFIVRNGVNAKTVKDLKGMKILSAPGPANMSAARAVLKANGLEEGRDYTLTEQPMGVHVGALQSGAFDAAYTLEPVATIAQKQGVARLLEAGVISTHLLGRKDALAFASGGAVTTKFLTERPAVAARYAAAWARAIKDVNDDPKVRVYLVKYLNTSGDIAPTVPLPKFVMSRNLRPVDIRDFQKFIDLAVDSGVVKDKVDVKTVLKAF